MILCWVQYIDRLRNSVRNHLKSSYCIMLFYFLKLISGIWILLPTFWGWIIRLVPLQTMSSNHLELITFRWMLRCGRSHVWWRRLTQVSVAQQMIYWRVKLHQIRNIDVKRIKHPTTHCYQKLLIILRLHPQVDINIPNSVTSKRKKKKKKKRQMVFKSMSVWTAALWVKIPIAIQQVNLHCSVNLLYYPPSLPPM